MEWILGHAIINYQCGRIHAFIILSQHGRFANDVAVIHATTLQWFFQFMIRDEVFMGFRRTYFHYLSSLHAHFTFFRFFGEVLRRFVFSVMVAVMSTEGRSWILRLLMIRLHAISVFRVILVFNFLQSMGRVSRFVYTLHPLIVPSAIPIRIISSNGFRRWFVFEGHWFFYYSFTISSQGVT